MCPWDTDAPIGAKFAYSNRANKSAAGMQHTSPRDIFNVSNVNQGL